MGVFVLVIGEGTPLPSALALTLRLTPTPLQICCAKARTSGRKSFVSVNLYFWKSFLRPCFRSDHRACTSFLGLGDEAGANGYRIGGNMHFANQPASTVFLLRLGLRR